ncbi:BMC domain-containing protein [Vallitalea guaymasensis]|uniref:BMC domain-containing protein n=1 Tax=Vallitalea guaymasensis TaxID=1185412 RepID=UPI002357EF0F|nr:BMC domain-containing protein [Vallitalea guaymasensis]
MDYALGMVEFKNIAMGITVTDLMVKAANVSIVKSLITCPGKYMVIIRGKLSAVNAAIDKSKEYEELVSDYFILGNPHESIFNAFDGKYEINKDEAMGIIETSNVPCLIEAADMIAKTARCYILKIKMARELGGKALVLFAGEVAAVEASSKAAIRYVTEKDKLISHSIIANPDPMIWDAIIK